MLVSMKRGRSAVGVLLLCLLFTSSMLAQGYCLSASAIDLVPYFVGQTYQDILRRVPDSAGQVASINSLKNLNATECKAGNPGVASSPCEWNNNAQLILDLLSSGESISKNGILTDNRAFITALYQLLLRRAADSEDLSYYSALLNSGATRLSVVSQFLSSSEYRQRFACTSAGNANPSCNGSEAIDPVSSFISQSYLDILERPASKAEQASWTSYTTSNQAAMCHNISGSAFSACDRLMEAQTALKLLETNAIESSWNLLERLPWPPSGRLHVPFLNNDGVIYNSIFVNNSTFVISLYEHLLRRNPDVKGLEFYTKYLNETQDRQGTIYGFLTSEEYRERFACYAGERDKLNFGINGHPLTKAAYSDTHGVDFATQSRLVREAGLRWYRFDLSAPSSGFDFNAMDHLLSEAQAQGVQLLPGIIPAVDPSTDTLQQLYQKSYAGTFAIVSHYKNSIHVWELWNERDVYSIYRQGDPWKGGTYRWGPPSGDSTADYYPPRMAISEAVIHGIADAVRDADPRALRIVNFGWLHTGYLQNLEDDGIPYDIVGVHWYSNPDVETEGGMGDMTCPGQNLPCKSPQQYPSLIPTVVSITNGKPLWVTETNYWPMPGNSVSMDLSQEAEYLPSALELYRDSPSIYPFQVVLLYELLDEPALLGDGPFYSEMGIYETIQANGHVTLGPAKPVYAPVESMLAPK